MKVGVLTVLYHDLPLEEALDRIAALGVRTVELATGNYVGNAHADPEALLADAGALGRLRGALDSRGMAISALSQHGNPLHPDPGSPARTMRRGAGRWSWPSGSRSRPSSASAAAPAIIRMRAGRTGSPARGRRTSPRRSRGSGRSA